MRALLVLLEEPKDFLNPPPLFKAFFAALALRG